MGINKAERWGQWLRTALNSRGWSQSDLVRAGHLSRANVSRWYRGIDTPTHRNTVVVAHALGVELSEALTAAGFTPSDLPIPTIRLQDYTDRQLLEELLRRDRARQPEAPHSRPHVVHMLPKAIDARMDSSVWDEPAAALDPGTPSFIDDEQEEMERNP